MYKYYEAGSKSQRLSLKDRFYNINWGYVLCIALLRLSELWCCIRPQMAVGLRGRQNSWRGLAFHWE